MSDPLKQLSNAVLSILLSSTLRISLVLLLLVSCYTCIAMLMLTPASLPERFVVLVALVVPISAHHWLVMIK